MLVMCTKQAKCPFNFLAEMVFMSEAKNERSTGAGSHCCQNLKYENFTSLFGRDYVKEKKKIAPQGVPHVLFFLIQSIISLICDVFVAVAVVDS